MYVYYCTTELKSCSVSFTDVDFYAVEDAFVSPSLRGTRG